MNLLSYDHLTELAQKREGPCLSLYLPTQRHFPDNRPDSIRFRGLISQLEASLSKHSSARETADLLQPMVDLVGNHDFWNHTLDGLAIFAAAGFSEVILLQHSVPELTVVSDTFHTKPLRKILQSSDSYQILALSLQEVKLYEGNRYVLDEVILEPGFPNTLTKALGDEITEPQHTVASNGGTSQATHHGHGGASEESEKDRDRFFRVIDRALQKNHINGLPLILAALPEHHQPYQAISRHITLVKEGIKKNPDALSNDQLREQAWKIVEPHYLDRLKAAGETFRLAKSQGLGFDKIETVAEAIFNGRVATLLIESERTLPGRIHPGSGRISFSEDNDPQVDDLLDDLGESVLQKGGHVHVIPAAQMPTSTGIAAICRY